MMRSNCLACLGMLLLFLSAAAAAQTDEQATEPSADDIDRLVQRLEDPESRAQLIGDLELLMQAERNAGAASGQSSPSAGGVLQLLKESAIDAWNELKAIDPRELLISCLVTVAILAGALVVRWLLLQLLRRLYARITVGKTADAAADTAGQPAAARQTDDKAGLPLAVTRLLNLIIGVLAVALIAETWGAGVTDLLRTNLGARIAETALSVGLILIFTVALWNASEILVERLLKLGSRKLDRERTLRRLDTLVPLMTSVSQTTISVFSGLLILSELGVNIGPLLAGAGIVGLAVGFGAQTLVKDLITGITILLEDAATVGDVVEVAGHTGVVEEMRIRVIQMRDIAGIVYMIPYSEVTAVKNYTKDFSYYLFEIGVAYREDTDNVCEVLAEVSNDLCSDDEFRREIIEPLQILGVDKFADSAVVIKARIKTLPGSQWRIGREFNRRMKKRFDEAGIEIPFPHTTLYFGEPKQGDAPAMQLALANAEQQLLERLASGAAGR